MTDESMGGARTMPEIDITLLGRFAVKVDGVAVADNHWKRHHAAAPHRYPHNDGAH